ncbi:MAG: glutamate-5-semialdehyde dehydrogenase [Nannocystaceae bacterium]|nr:glutamate-5-semialdehyde dehydrogenase [bacterium]
MNDSSIPARLRAAKAAGLALSHAPPGERREVLLAMADTLCDPAVRASLKQANDADVADAEAARARGELSDALVRRLVLTTAKLDVLAEGLRQLAAQDDLVGRVLESRELDDGLVLRRESCPLGVLGIVFEARPDAVPQIVGLALRTGNAIALKGGREATRSNAAMVDALHGALERVGLDPALVALLEGRAEVSELLEQQGLVDLVIARGSAGFVDHVMQTSKVPVVGHAEGLCHIFLHGSADPAMAAAVVRDAKTDYPAACNAVETLLWEPGAEEALLRTVEELQAHAVTVRGCEHTRAVCPVDEATDADWDAEYGDLVLSVCRVDGLGGALEHIERHGSRHTECILAADQSAADQFIARVDAACVFHNASTRFADGYRFGLGAEVGISTQKLHARGPVGVGGLVTYRWLLRGEGQVASDYGPGKRSFKFS